MLYAKMSVQACVWLCARQVLIVKIQLNIIHYFRGLLLL